MESRCVLARQPLDYCVCRLTARCVENLNIVRVRRLADSRTLAIKNGNNVLVAPILIIAQLFDQNVARERRSAIMKLAQFGPPKNNTVAINNEIPRTHSITLSSR